MSEVIVDRKNHSEKEVLEWLKTNVCRCSDDADVYRMIHAGGWSWYMTVGRIYVQIDDEQLRTLFILRWM